VATWYKGCVSALFVTYLAAIWVETIWGLTFAIRIWGAHVGRDSIVMIGLATCCNTPTTFLFFGHQHLNVAKETIGSTSRPLVNDRHVLQVSYVVSLHDKDSAANLYNVINFQRMKVALLSFCTQSQPGPIRRANVL
jgi:hypothetical protein